jgi:hypothetical protein
VDHPPGVPVLQVCWCSHCWWCVEIDQAFKLIRGISGIRCKDTQPMSNKYLCQTDLEEMTVNNFQQVCTMKMIVHYTVMVQPQVDIQGVPGGMYNTLGACSLC